MQLLYFFGRHTHTHCLLLVLEPSLSYRSLSETLTIRGYTLSDSVEEWYLLRPQRRTECFRYLQSHKRGFFNNTNYTYMYQRLLSLFYNEPLKSKSLIYISLSHSKFFQSGLHDGVFYSAKYKFDIFSIYK